MSLTCPLAIDTSYRAPFIALGIRASWARIPKSTRNCRPYSDGRWKFPQQKFPSHFKTRQYKEGTHDEVPSFGFSSHISSNFITISSDSNTPECPFASECFGTPDLSTQECTTPFGVSIAYIDRSRHHSWYPVLYYFSGVLFQLMFPTHFWLNAK